MQNRIAYQEIYDYGRLEKAALSLHMELTEETETGLLNLHNHLIWHSYKSGADPAADAILSSAIAGLLEEYGLDASCLPAELRDAASSVEERR